MDIEFTDTLSNLNNDHWLEFGPESCFCNAGIRDVVAIDNTAHIYLVRRVLFGQEYPEWPLVHWDEEEQEGISFTPDLSLWFSSWLAEFPAWADNDELRRERDRLVEQVKVWGDDRAGLVIDAILDGETSRATLHTLVAPAGFPARIQTAIQQGDLRLGWISSKPSIDVDRWTALMHDFPDHNTPLAVLVADPAGLSKETAWRWLGSNLKYDTGGSIGQDNLTQRVCAFLETHDPQFESPYWPIVVANAQSCQGGDSFVEAGNKLAGEGRFLESITAFENAILFEGAYSEEFHMGAWEAMQKAIVHVVEDDE